MLPCLKVVIYTSNKTFLNTTKKTTTKNKKQKTKKNALMTMLGIKNTTNNTMYSAQEPYL